jgi:enterochelin esterase-like enzyme
MTRKAVKLLLIAATLGVAVALFVRSRPRPGAPAADAAEPEPVRPVRHFPPRQAEPAPRAALPAGPSAPDGTRELPVVEADAEPESPFAPVPPAAVAVPSAVAPGVVEIDPDRLPPLPSAPEPSGTPAGRRRSQRVLGGVVAAFVVAAGAVSVLAYRAVDGGDDKAPAGSAVSASPSAAQPSGPPSFGPLAPQNFTAVGDRSGGSLSRITLDGRRSGVRADVWVWLPPQYKRSDFQTKKFPVLMLHSAYPGVGENSLLSGQTSALSKIADGIARGTLPPFVVVAPELTPYTQAELDAAADPSVLDTECSDIPGKAKMATFHNEDVREAVAATFRVTNDRNGWALLGEGAGGLCAAKYALQYPQYYVAGASLSGPTTLKSPLWGAAQAARDGQSLKTLLAAHPDVSLFLSDNTSDTVGRQASNVLKAAAAKPTDIETANAGGGTVKQLPSALSFLADTVTDSSGARPPTGTNGKSGNR